MTQLFKNDDEINEMLKAFNLFAFNHRIVFRISMFLHKMINGFNATKQLNDWLKPSEINRQHTLRSNAKNLLKCERSYSKSGESRFKNIFAKYINKIKHYLVIF